MVAWILRNDGILKEKKKEKSKLDFFCCPSPFGSVLKRTVITVVLCLLSGGVMVSKVD